MNLNARQFWLLMGYLLAILAAFNNCSGFAPSSLQSTSPNNNASQIGGLPSQIPPGPANPRTAYYVDQGKLFDPCGEEVILRGVNKMAAFADRQGDSFPEIAKSGANTVRFMWLTMIEPSEAVQTLQRAVDSKLIPIWELHDATGDWSKMLDIEAYWTSSATLDVLKRFDAKMIVNLANEAGATVSNQELTTLYSRLVRKLRDAGVKAPLMIDASGWGRNAEQLLEIAPILLNQDPLHNLIFSWHVYDSGSDQPARIQRVASSFKQQKLPFIIGEFGPKSPGACHLDVPWLEVIRTAQQLGLGYLPWSWDNFNGDCEDGEFSVFDLVTDGIHLSTLRSGWATEVIMTDAASINQTSRRTAWQEQGRCQ